MRTTINLDDQILMRAKKEAAAEQVTLGAFVESCIRRSLSQRTGKKKHIECRLPVITGKLVDPTADLDRTSQLVTASDQEVYRDADSRKQAR